MGAVRRAAWRYVPRSQIARWLRVAALVVVVSACWGVATASAEANLGPHLARYDVTVDGEVTVDLGPLGTLVIDSPLPLTLGMHVTVLEIPSEVTAVDRVSTLEALGSDLDQYVQFFTGPQATLQVVLRDLVVDASARTAFAVLVLGGGVVLVRAALGDRRRQEIAASLRPYRRAMAGSAALVLLVAATVTSGVPGRERLSSAQSASAVFDGTPLEGARITGRLAGVIDTYGGYLIDAYRESEAFYAQVTADLRDEWADRAAADRVFASLQRERATRSDESTGGGGEVGASAHGAAQDPRLGEGRGDTDDDGGDGEPGQEAGADPGTDGDGRGASGVDLTGSTVVGATDEATDPVVALVVSDLHCNVGMAPVIGALAELAEVDVVLNAGDTTVNGTAVEAYCVNAFISALPAGVPMVVADGNHDSRLTAVQEQAAGAIVLDGAALDVAGIRILGDSDPNETRIGAGTVAVEGETRSDAAARLAEVACDDTEGVDLLLVHTPGVGTPALQAGCVPAQVSGHMHRREGPEQVGAGIRYVSGSTAGATLAQPTVGRLRGTAELTVLRLDPVSGSVIDHRLVQVSPDGTVTVDRALGWPEVVAAPPRNSDIR